MENQSQTTVGKDADKENAKIGIIPTSELKGSDADTAYPGDGKEEGVDADHVAHEVKGSDAEPDDN